MSGWIRQQKGSGYASPIYRGLRLRRHVVVGLQGDAWRRVGGSGFGLGAMGGGAQT